MTAIHRRFTVTTTTEFVITEVEPTTKHPMNWIDNSHTDKSAWMAAQTQTLPVRYIDRDGNATTYGVVFHPEAFERACYRGYVAYGLSMTDGWFTPLPYEAWVVAFRNDPAGQVGYGNDAPATLKAALPAYLARRATV